MALVRSSGLSYTVFVICDCILSTLPFPSASLRRTTVKFLLVILTSTLNLHVSAVGLASSTLEI